MAERYVSALAGGGGVGSEVSPWTWAQMITAINNATVADGDRCNVKADGTYTSDNITITRNCAHDGHIIVQGYTDTIGDEGQATIQRTAGQTGTWITANAYINPEWKDITFDSDDVGNTSGMSIHTHPTATFIRCKFMNAQAYSYTVYGGIFINCFFLKSAQAIISFGYYCLFDGVDKSRVGLISSSNCYYCIAYRCSIGFNQQGQLMNCIAHDCTNGLNMVNSPHSIFNVAISDCPGYGVTINAGATVDMYNCNIHNCGADVISGVGIFYNKTTLAPQYNDPSAYDFTRIGSNLDDIGFSKIGMLFDYNIDIGPDQKIKSDYPAEAVVIDGVSYNNGDSEGDFEVPSEDDVEDGVGFGSLGTQYEGNVELPSEAEVESGVGFGAGGTEFEGSLIVTAVETPIQLEVEDDEIVLGVE